ncbi:MAG: ABC transporter permease [Pseudomonadota bacterium]
MTVLLSYGVRNLRARMFTTALTASGMAMVTFVFTAVLMLAEGLERTLADTGSPDNVVILRRSAETEVSSIISRYEAAQIEVGPEPDHTVQGEPMISKESVVLVTLPKKNSPKPTNVVVRGVGPWSVRLRPQVRLKSGRMFRPGSHEIIAGSSAARRITGLELNGELRFALREWRVVGIFDAADTAFDSEIWGDADQLMDAFRRNSYSAMIVRVSGPGSFDRLKKRIENDPRMTVQAKREIAFYREQSEVMTKFIRILGIVTTGFFSFGAILGAMVTMYTAVANRTKEIGTLRALGFSRAGVLSSFLAESVFLGVLGGGVGVAASSLLQLVTISTLNWETFSELAFGFTLTGGIAAYAIGFSAFMGFIGGLVPAWTAARLKIVDALRAS